MFPWGGTALGPAPVFFAGGLLGILTESCGCLDTSSHPWHSCENVRRVQPSPYFVWKESEG